MCLFHWSVQEKPLASFSEKYKNKPQQMTENSIKMIQYLTYFSEKTCLSFFLLIDVHW